MKTQNLYRTLGIIALSSNCFAQPFQTSVIDRDADFNHCSTEQTSEGYVTVGTRFQRGNNDIYIAYFDADGNPVWERFIDHTKDDRGLDVAVDDYDNIVLTGYTSELGYGNPDLYLAKLDIDGNFITDRIMEFNTTPPYRKGSAGTNIIYSSSKNTFLVGGYLALENAVPLVQNGAFVAEITPDLDLIQDRILFRNYAHQTINDIVEVPDGYVVTGGLSYTPDQQVVMLIKIDNSLSISKDLSFGSKQSADQCGVSLVYDAKDDYLAVLSNNAEHAVPQVNIFTDLSGVTSLYTTYLLQINREDLGFDPAGFKLEPSVTTSGNLVASGYYRDAINVDGSNDHALAWIVEFELKGSPVNGLIWESPEAPGFAYHGDDVLSTFVGTQPYVYTQEMMIPRLDKEGYVMIAPRMVDKRYGYDFFTTSHLEESSCFRSFRFDLEKVAYERHYADQTTLDWNVKRDVTRLDEIGNEYEQFCEAGRSAQLNTDQFADLSNIQVYPNPSHNGLFTINMKENSNITTLQVFNTQGKMMLNQTVNSTQVQVDAHNFPSGVYWVKCLNVSGESYQTKIVLFND